MVSQIYPHSLRRNFIIPNSFKSPSISGIDQHHNQGNADSRHHKGKDYRSKRREVPKQVGTIGNGSQLIPLEHRTDDLRKSQSRNRQVITLQTQYRKSDEVSKGSRHNSSRNESHRNRKRELNDSSVKILIYTVSGLHRNSQNGVSISTQQHKARLAQGKQSGKSIQKIHRHCYQSIDSTFF